MFGSMQRSRPSTSQETSDVPWRYRLVVCLLKNSILPPTFMKGVWLAGFAVIKVVLYMLVA